MIKNTNNVEKEASLEKDLQKYLRVLIYRYTWLEMNYTAVSSNSEFIPEKVKQEIIGDSKLYQTNVSPVLAPLSSNLFADSLQTENNIEVVKGIFASALETEDGIKLVQSIGKKL